MDNRPIGVFDSGLGGLTAVRELKALLPGEQIIYFGDTGRVPYGSRSHATIERYAVQDAALLLRRGVKTLLSACGTVSAVAGELLAKQSPCPYIEVVTPAVQRALQLSVTGRIGVIATRATIASGQFQRLLTRPGEKVQVTEVACPLFVPLVEEGHFAPDDDLVQSVVRLYLGELRRARIDTLILGCTHFPLLADAIALYMGKDVVLVDSGREAAKATAELLRLQGLLSGEAKGGCRCLVTDAPANFEKHMRLFMGGESCTEVEQVMLETLEEMETLS